MALSCSFSRLGKGLLNKMNLLSILRAEETQPPQRVCFQPCREPQGGKASCCLGRDGVLEDKRAVDFLREKGRNKTLASAS